MYIPKPVEIEIHVF